MKQRCRNITWIASIAVLAFSLFFILLAASVPPTLAIQASMSTHAVTTTPTVILESHGIGTTTDTVEVATSSPGTLLNRLTQNKPGIWGNKVFYVVLSVTYVILLTLLLLLVFRLARPSD